MTYKVCIPTAGTGSRLRELTRYLNKSLVSIANRPTICHIIEQFPLDTKFVIALGYKGDLVKEFLSLTYPNRVFDYALVDHYEGTGSGLGLSLLACKSYLQEPFIFISCDTLVDEVIPPPHSNWMGYAYAQNLDSYRTLEIVENRAIGICEKGIGRALTHKPYIGLAGIFDYQMFWSKMEVGGFMAIQMGEVYGLKGLLSKGIEAKSFTWHDTGNVDDLNKVRDFYRKPDEPNILEKSNEAIWFVDNSVIKFSEDKQFIANRVARAQELDEFVPKIVRSSTHMYCYAKVDGRVFSDVVNLPLFKTLLQHSSRFWKIKNLNEQQQMSFNKTCMRFYRDKTYERVELFYKKFSREDGREIINGVEMPLLKELLNDVDWQWLSEGLAGRFHGDFHFENILYSPSNQIFTFLDWRQDFGGDLSVGDIYYDFAKLLHGLIINHEIIARDYYEIMWLSDSINFDFHRKQKLVQCEGLLDSWLESKGYDKKKVRVLTALIYLNIAALHHDPYGLLLFALGKSMLKVEMEF
jgi:dTDP-glucose pyrophosphorylase